MWSIDARPAEVVFSLVMRFVQSMREKMRRHGVLNALYARVLMALHSALALKILRGVHVERPDASFLECSERYAPGFLAAGELRKHAQTPEIGIAGTFLDEAAARGDACYAIREGESLAAYGWYSRGSAPVGLQGLLLHFSPDYIYMYKGFTDVRHRGQRLHAIGMTRALDYYVRKGYKGFVSYVEATNFDSLKSCFRMGYRVFGSIYVVRIFGRNYAFSSPGCRRFKFRLERAPAHRGAPSFGKT